MQKNTALALGAFDGLHKGHLKVILKTLKDKNLIPAVLTFNADPSVSIDGSSEYLIDLDEKEKILHEIGIKKIFKFDFDKIRHMSPEEFFKEIIVDTCKAKSLFCGENFRFGKNASGDIETLKELAKQYNVKVNVVSYCTNHGKIISSTLIREAISDGDMKLAKDCLGRYFAFDFVVVIGNKIGRTLGTPTINQALPKGFVLPKFGVYVSRVTVQNKQYCGVTNIGVKPSIGKYDPLSETWILDLDKNMYGMKIKVELIEFIRAEKRFENLTLLKEEIHKDAIKAKKIFEKLAML